MSKWILGVLALVLIGGGLYISSQNAAEARRRAAAITAADVAGQDTAATLAGLKEYSAAHMGAGVTVTLTGSLQRAQAAAQQAAAAAQSANSEVYAAAQQACGGRRDSVTQAKCVQEYVSARLVAVPTPTPVPPLVQSDYQRRVNAPFWTPDLAGALLAGGAAALILAAAAFIKRRPHQ